MTDLDTRIAMHAYGQFGLGVLLMFLGCWTLARGLQQRPFRTRRRRRWLPVIPGRVPFGMFLICLSYPVLEFGVNRIRPLTADGRIRANNDADTLIFIYVGLVFAVWTAIRFKNNDVGGG